MAENLVPSNISQGVNIPRAERVKPSFLGKLGERFGSRKAPFDAEQETHAKERVPVDRETNGDRRPFAGGAFPPSGHRGGV